MSTFTLIERQRDESNAKPTYEHLVTITDRREQWGLRWMAWQAQLMHRYARRISKRHKNPLFSLENVK